MFYNEATFKKWLNTLAFFAEIVDDSMYSRSCLDILGCSAGES